MHNTEERSTAIDALRCLAAVSVIAQHVSGDGMLSSNPMAATLVNGLSLLVTALAFATSAVFKRMPALRAIV